MGTLDLERGTVFDAAVAELRKLGAILVEGVELPRGPELGDAEMEVLTFELKADIPTYLAARGDPSARSTIWCVSMPPTPARSFPAAWF